MRNNHRRNPHQSWSGLAETEIMRELQLRPPVELRTRVPKSPMLRTPFRTMIEILAFRPKLAAGIPEIGHLKSEGIDLIELSKLERAFFEQLCGRLRPDADPLNLTEAFRGSDLEAMAQEVERATLDWEDKALDETGLQQELTGALRAVREQIRKARQKNLLETLGQRHWTQEETEQFRKLQQPVE